MKTLPYLIFSIFLSIQQVFAINTHIDYPTENGSLKGRITEKKGGQPLPRATVVIPDLQLDIVANDEGKYQFKSLPEGTFLVEVRYIGYKTVAKSITISGATTANFELSDLSFTESAIVVTGSSKATQVKRNPVPIVSISHSYLNTNFSTNIIDAIAKVPGVNAITTGPNVSKPSIRGLGYNRVLTLFDGVRQEGQQWGDEHGIEVDQFSVDHIEVIKGPASLSYGSDALAGVVNLIPTPAFAEGKKGGSAIMEYQTNNGMYGGSAYYGETHNGLEWLLRLTNKRATNYQNSVDGRVYNTGFRETDGSLSLGMHRHWGYSHLSLSVYDDLQEIPDGSRDSLTRQFTQQVTEIDTFRPIVSPAQLKSYSLTPLHQHVQHYRAFLTNNFILGNYRLGLNLGYQTSVRREFSHPELPYQDVAGLYLILNTFSYDAKIHFPEYRGWNLTAGINGMYQVNNITKGTDFIVPSYTQFDAGPFVLLKKTIDKLDIAGGARFDSRSFQNSSLYTRPDPVSGFPKPYNGAITPSDRAVFNNYAHTFTGASGSVGATYNFTEQFSLKANLARGYRAPNIAEISSNGVHPGTNIYQIGNPYFVPEFSLQEDIGGVYSTKFATVSLSLFNNSISNYIFNQRLESVHGGDSVIVAGNQTYKYQQGKAKLYGGELTIDFHPIQRLHIENSISLVLAENKGLDAKSINDSNKYLPFIPPLHGISEISMDFSNKKAHLTNGYIKCQLAWYATQNRVYRVDNTETRTPGYALVNAGIGTGITNKKGNRIATVSIMANNLFDVTYQDHLSRLKYFEPYSHSTSGHYGIYNMGRNISFSLELPF